MTCYADPTRCPDCGTSLAGASRCPGCLIDLGGPLGGELFTALRTADALLERLRAQPLTATQAPSVLVEPDRQPAPVVLTPRRLRPDRPRPGVRAATVPKILLASGALCLLAAALVFLAVTWETLGVGGRTLALLAVTTAAGVITWWSASRGLRAAVEALGTVTLGLAILDVLGAHYAGWLGDPSEPTLTAMVGGGLVLGGFAVTQILNRTPAGGFVSGRVATVLGSLLVVVGLVGGDWSSLETRLLAAVLVSAALAAATAAAQHRGLLEVLDVQAMAAVPVLAWSGLFFTGADLAFSRPMMTVLLGDGRAWPLLAAALVALAAGAARAVPVTGRVTAVGAALVCLACIAVAPALDEPPEVLLGLVLLAVALAVTGMAAAPRPWTAAGLGVALLGALVLTLASAFWLASAGTRYAGVASAAWSGTAGGRFGPTPPDLVASPWLLAPTLAVLVAFAWAVLDTAGTPVRARTAAVAAGVAFGVGLLATLTLLDAPVWLVLALVVCVGATLAAAALRRDDLVLAVGAGGVLLAGVVLGAHSELHTAAAVGVALLVASSCARRARSLHAALVAGAAVGPLLAALVWTIGAIFIAPGELTALGGLLALAAPAWLRLPAPERSEGLEIGTFPGVLALGSLGVASVPGTEESVWLAVYLTVAGAAVVVHSLLHPDRRIGGWLGGGLLAAATWVRLADLGVEAPEPYTLPTAVALLAVGWLRLHRSPHASTVTALGPGLTLALIPSLLWAYSEPLSLRAVLLGTACLALAAGGAQLRWSAPLGYGAVVGVLLVLREAAPFIGDGVPRWVLIGLAGSVLIAMGVSWEQRTRDARAMLGYVRQLR